METSPCDDNEPHPAHTRWAKVYDQNQGKDVPRQVYCPGRTKDD